MEKCKDRLDNVNILSFVKKRVLLNKFKTKVLVILFFWYLAVFPGRAGADAVGLMQIIRSGLSTDWWTASYFWFIKYSTFNGRTIAITSLIQLLILAYSMYWSVSSIPISKRIIQNSYLLFLTTPIFGVFAVTIGHDSFQTAGLLILLGTELRNFYGRTKENTLQIYLLSFICLTTTHSGKFIIIAALIILLFRKKTKVAILSICIITAISIISTFGVSKSLYNGVSTVQTSEIKYMTMIADLKCVAQHPQAEINNSEWEVLLRISPRTLWEVPVSCADVSQLNFYKPQNSGLDYNSYIFYKTYLSVSSKNPAIVVMAHIQRARGILPPPFFQKPDNQVPLDVKIPIGQNTNTALQTGPELLHPSIDDPYLKVNVPFLKPLEILAQGGTFLFNQASWFWGWAGLWCYPIIFFYLVVLRVTRFSRVLLLLYPIALSHSILFLVVPTSLARYYMVAILYGFYLTIILIYLVIEAVKEKGINKLLRTTS